MATKKTKITKAEAKAKAQLAGIDFSKSWFTVRISDKGLLKQLAAQAGYRKPANSRADTVAEAFFASLARLK